MRLLLIQSFLKLFGKTRFADSAVKYEKIRPICENLV